MDMHFIFRHEPPLFFFFFPMIPSKYHEKNEKIIICQSYMCDTMFKAKMLPKETHIVGYLKSYKTKAIKTHFKTFYLRINAIVISLVLGRKVHFLFYLCSYKYQEMVYGRRRSEGLVSVSYLLFDVFCHCNFYYFFTSKNLYIRRCEGAYFSYSTFYKKGSRR